MTSISPPGWTRFVAPAIFIILTACAQRSDFGRPARTVWNEAVDATGAISADQRGEPVSAFPLTDDEELLRTRAWHFLMPSESRSIFEAILANLQRSRVLPPRSPLRDVASYHDGLIATGFRSPTSRYRKLAEDAAADGRLLPAFAAAAGSIIEADMARLRALPQATGLEETDVRNAVARIAENRCIIAWVRTEAAVRVLGYRYALDHLLVAMPGREGVATERTIAFLHSRRTLLNPLLPPDAEARCGLVPVDPSAALASPLVAKY